jgi:hypothetical protein
MEDLDSLKAGMGAAHWIWKRRERNLSVEVFVSGTGPSGARQRLIEIATNTTMVENRMVVARERVGELAIEDLSRDGNDIDWVFRNVCVSVHHQGSGPDLVSVARRIQSFLVAHLSPDVASHVPKIASIEISKKVIRPGDTFEVRVLLPHGVRSDQLSIDVRPASWPMLDPIEYRETSVVFQATDPGPAELDVIVLDPVTLLSPKAGVVIDVLPAVAL